MKERNTWVRDAGFLISQGNVFDCFFLRRSNVTASSYKEIDKEIISTENENSSFELPCCVDKTSSEDKREKTV